MGRAPIKKTKNPAVIVDVLFEDMQFFILIHNNTDQPVYKVSIKFDKTIIGWNGSRNISAMKVFEKIETLAPRKTIRVFIDRGHSYFARRQPAVIVAQITYTDASGSTFISSLKHNLSIYRDITFPLQPGTR